MKTLPPFKTAMILLAASAVFALMLQSAPPSTPGAAPASNVAPLSSRVIDWEKLVVKTTPNGQSRAVFNGPTATLVNLECHITTLLPGKISHPPHRHPHEEIIIIKEGTIEVNLNGQSQRVGPGSILFYAPNDLHGLKNVGDTLATYHVFSWKSRETKPE